MDLGIADKRALVLASSKGLGRAIAERLAAEGAHVLVSGRSGDLLDGLVDGIRAAGGRADRVVADLSDPASAMVLAEAATDTLGGVDILVNNTGGPPPGPITEVEPDAWRAHFDTMIVRVFDVTRRLVPGMKAQGWGRVLTVASTGVMQPIPGLGISNALRSAIVGWNKTLADEVAADGVTANVLAPGRIATDRLHALNAATAERQGKSVEAVVEDSLATIPARRFGTPAEFADVAAFLVSERAAYVTGSVVRCDGGAVKGV